MEGGGVTTPGSIIVPGTNPAKVLDTTVVTTSEGTVHREVVVHADPTNANGLTKVANAAPSQSDYGSVVRSVNPPLVCTSYINTYLLNGGSEDMTVNGSSTPVEFSYTASGDSSIGRIMLYLESSGAMDSTKFGDLTALGTGVTIVCNGTTIGTWKDNIDIITSMYDFSWAGKAFGKETKVLTGRWTLWKADSDTRGMELDDGDVLKAVVNDNLTGLSIFRIRLQGIVL